MSDLNMYGEIARDYLEEHFPDEFKRLQRAGQLNAHLIKKQERVSDLIFQTEESLLDKDPPPDEPFLATVSHHYHAHSQAVEIVLNDLFPPRLPPDEIEDEIPPGPPAALIET